MRIYLLPFLLLLASCGKQYTAISPKDPIYRDKDQKLTVFEEKGEKYQRRGDLTIDTTRFAPGANETYESYRRRILNTLVAQEQEIIQLQNEIENTGFSISDLQAQLGPMEQQQAEMRIALSNDGSSEEMAQLGQKKNRFLFERYVIQKGDTLQQIAQDRYGTYTAWIALYRFNHSRLPFGPNRIEEGTTLLIPNMEALEALPMSEMEG